MYNHKSIEELNSLLQSKQISKKELFDESILLSNKLQEKCNAFVTINDNYQELEDTNSILNGIPFGVKDNYSTKDILTTASSNSLKDYIPFFNATVVENLLKKGAIIANKTAMDEFGMGGTGTTGHTGIIKNPWDTHRSCSGSSSGSAAAVSFGVYPYALASDTGDSIRKPAAYCGIVGYKPTYGMLSRYGLIPFASSLDTCGVLTRNVKDAAVVVNEAKGIDELDMTSWDSSHIDLVKNIEKIDKQYKLCYFKEICDINSYTNPSEELINQLKIFKETIDILKNNNVEVDEISFDKELLLNINSVYNVISCAEATSNLSNLTGIVFGPRDNADKIEEIIKNYRTKGFSPLIKRRLVIGSYVLEKENQERYYKNALKVRRLIVDKVKDIFKKYDAFILPVGEGPAKKFSELNNKTTDEINIIENHLQIGNFGGFPSITIPNGFINNLPVGINITGNCYDDENVLKIAYLLEKNMNFKNMIAKESAHE